VRHFLAEDYSKVKRKGKGLKSFLKQDIKFIKKEYLRIIGIAGVLIFVIVIFYFVDPAVFLQRKKAASEEPQSPAKNIVVPNITQAPPKEVAGGFPKNLTLNSKTAITGSYSATYPNSPAKQATVEFISSKSPEANFDFYTKWAKDNGWDVVNSSNNGDSISFLYFKKASEQINITIRSSVKIAAGSDIVISYVNLNK